MSIKFSEDVVPFTDLKVNPGRVVKHAAKAHRPVLLTSRGAESPSCSRCPTMSRPQRSAPSCARWPRDWPTWTPTARSLSRKPRPDSALDSDMTVAPDQLAYPHRACLAQRTVVAAAGIGQFPGPHGLTIAGSSPGRPRSRWTRYLGDIFAGSDGEKRLRERIRWVIYRGTSPISFRPLFPFYFLSYFLQWDRAPCPRHAYGIRRSALWSADRHTGGHTDCVKRASVVVMG